MGAYARTSVGYAAEVPGVELTPAWPLARITKDREKPKGSTQFGSSPSRYWWEPRAVVLPDTLTSHCSSFPTQNASHFANVFVHRSRPTLTLHPRVWRPLVSYRTFASILREACLRVCTLSRDSVRAPSQLRRYSCQCSFAIRLAALAWLRFRSPRPVRLAPASTHDYAYRCSGHLGCTREIQPVARNCGRTDSANVVEVHLLQLAVAHHCDESVIAPQ
jgi:hypothetical protein